MHKTGKLLVISGPSAGAGKDTILKLLLEADPTWHQPPSTTTRQPRTGETPGKDMNFISKDEFASLKDEGKFLETDNHADHWYGTLQKPVEDLLRQGEKVVLRVDVNGALQIKKKLPEAILVFIKVENMHELEKRIRARATEDDATIKSRLALAKQEMPMQTKFDHTIVNPPWHPEVALQELLDIVK